MSWIAQSSVEEDESIKAMRDELNRQQEEAARIFLQKQKKKEQQMLQRQRRRKEQQAIRQEQQLVRPTQPRGASEAQEVPPGSVPPKPKRKNKPRAQSISSSTNSGAAAVPTIFGYGSNPSSSSSTQNFSPFNHPVYSSGTFADSLFRDDIASGSFESAFLADELDKKRSDNLVERKLTLEELSRFQSDYASDEDAIEADYYEPLARHGDHFTKEEVIRLYRAKLKHLRSMYTHQADFIKTAYKEKRRLYLAATEELANSNISYSSDPRILATGKCGKAKVTPSYIAAQMLEQKRMRQLMKCQQYKGSRAAVRLKAKRLYDEAKAKGKVEEERKQIISRSQKKKATFESGSDEDSNGSDEDDCESLFELFKEARESHNVVSTTENTKKTGAPTCSYQSSDYGSLKCPNLALPLTKYCYNHILKDEKQALFKSCGRPLGTKDDHCQMPVLNLLEKLGCQTHRIPFVKEEPEPFDTKKERLSLEAKLPVASAEEEVDILEDLVAEELYDMGQFEEAVKYIETKGIRAPDTDDSDEEEEADVPLNPVSDLVEALGAAEMKMEPEF